MPQIWPKGCGEGERTMGKSCTELGASCHAAGLDQLPCGFLFQITVSRSELPNTCYPFLNLLPAFKNLGLTWFHPPQNTYWQRPYCCLMLLCPRLPCPFSISSLEQLHCASQGDVWEGHGRTAGHWQFAANKPKAYWWAQQEKMGAVCEIPMFQYTTAELLTSSWWKHTAHIINRD